MIVMTNNPAVEWTEACLEKGRGIASWQPLHEMRSGWVAAE